MLGSITSLYEDASDGNYLSAAKDFGFAVLDLTMVGDGLSAVGKAALDVAADLGGEGAESLISRGAGDLTADVTDNIPGNIGRGAERDLTDVTADAGGGAVADDAGAALEGGGPSDAAANDARAQGCAGETNCFLAGTEVLAGDGTTEVQIQDIEVGDRVATDDGVANSPDGTAAADPNATAVDPATWREITITAGDWQVQVLEPLSWIATHNLSTGSTIALNDIVDLYDMGVPGDIFGTVQSISACPPIQSRPGRVVLATVSHLNDDVYNLTMTDANGNATTIGVTGYHKIYTEDRGWVDADALAIGEQVRSATGDVTVTALSQDPGTFRVYNMDAEDDHDYYVSDLDALVHNACPQGGVYTLTDKEGNVMRTGRTNDLARRELEHSNDPILGKFDFNVIWETNNKAARRGLEQMLNEEYNAPFDKIRAIAESNPNLSKYIAAARRFLASQ